MIFRASEEKFSAAKFHEKCDDIEHTLVVIETEFNRLIAGYTPFKWNSLHNDFVNDPTNASFLLSIDMKQKMSLVDNTRAIYCDSSYGPIFGGSKNNLNYRPYYDGDIYIVDKCN